MIETFIFAFNGAKAIRPMTMKAAIDKAREKAINGNSVRLSVGRFQEPKQCAHWVPTAQGRKARLFSRTQKPAKKPRFLHVM